MIFGKPGDFAVEALVEPGPEFGPVLGSNVVGRLRVWIGGEAIGRIEEPCCVLGCLANGLLEKLETLQTLWDHSFDGLSAEAIFDRLDGLLYGSRRGRSIREAWTVEQWNAVADAAHRYARFGFLTHTSEAFDGWKAFLVRPESDLLQALVARHPQSEVFSITFGATAFADAVLSFASWLSLQEQLLLPPQ